MTDARVPQLIASLGLRPHPEGGYYGETWRSPLLVRLGPFAEGQVPVYCVPAGWWQAARSLGGYTLVCCAVGPGFEFEDFELMSDGPEL